MRFALLVHVLAVIFWLGGMAFVHTALRPSLNEALEPPQRLTLLRAILRRFLAAVTLAIVVIFASGAVMLTGPAATGRPANHVMLGLAVLMTVVFAFLRIRPYAALQAAVAAGNWPAAASAAALVRRLVAFNLVVGIVIVATTILAS